MRVATRDAQQTKSDRICVQLCLGLRCTRAVGGHLAMFDVVGELFAESWTALVQVIGKVNLVLFLYRFATIQ